jgi:hypothetical protein
MRGLKPIILLGYDKYIVSERYTLWEINIDPENNMFLMELIFQPLSGWVYVNFLEGKNDNNNNDNTNNI